MRIKSGFTIHTIADEYVVVPIGDRTLSFNGMVRLNSSGAFLWNSMQDEFTKESLVLVLLEEYDVSEERAVETTERFLNKLLEGGIIEV